jgi:hypothetical protein
MALNEEVVNDVVVDDEVSEDKENASGRAPGDQPLPDDATHADYAPAASPEAWSDKSTGADAVVHDLGKCPHCGGVLDVNK